ncbi:MAG: translation initiation factor IF-6 [Candidatus Nitrosocaldaceae archaeon]
MLQKGVYKYNIYRTPNIGIFLKANDKLFLAPKGLTESKISRLESFLGVKCITTSIAYTRLLGPLVAMNSNAIILPRIIAERELEELRETNLEIIVLDTPFTSLGNLIAINDKGMIVSPELSREVINELKDRLSIEVLTMNIASYHQVGSMIVCTNRGAAIHPKVSDEQLEMIMDVLKVYAEPSTVNGGVPFVSTGIVANSNSVVVGDLTTGPELVILARAFKI